MPATIARSDRTFSRSCFSTPTRRSLGKSLKNIFYPHQHLQATPTLELGEQFSDEAQWPAKLPNLPGGQADTACHCFEHEYDFSVYP
jgi:hypothetical protein